MIIRIRILDLKTRNTKELVFAGKIMKTMLSYITFVDNKDLGTIYLLKERNLNGKTRDCILSGDGSISNLFFAN